MTQDVEPWLRGVLADLDPVCGHLLRSSEQIREDARRAIAISPVPGHATAFHLAHLAGSTDRLCTYAEGTQLSPEQLDALNAERDRGASPGERIALIDEAFDRYDALVRSTRPDNFGSIRHVGRKKLPVTLIGLLIHIVEHGQRHAGQAITTAKIAARAGS